MRMRAVKPSRPNVAAPGKLAAGADRDTVLTAGTPPAPARLSPPQRIAIGVVAAVAVLLLFGQTGGSTFYFDEWNFALDRRDRTLDAFLEPHYQHLSLVPILIYQGSLETLGMENAHEAVRLLAALLHVTCALLVLAYSRPRVGDRLALLAAALVLFMGQASSDVLWPFQFAYLIAVVGGLGALLAVERGDRRGDIATASLLTVGLASASVAIPFVLGVAIHVMSTGARWRRAWVPLAPVALYGLWYLAYGKSAFNGENVTDTPEYVAKMAGAAVRAVVGLSDEAWALPMAVAAGILLAWRLAGPRPIALSFRALLVVMFGLWVLTALARADEQPATALRYIYPGGVLVVLVVVESVRGVLPTTRASVVTGVLVAAACLSGVGAFVDQGNILQKEGISERSRLTAVEIMRDELPPGFVPDPQKIPQIQTAEQYFAALLDFGGSPALTLEELQSAPEADRAAVDGILLRAAPPAQLPVAELPDAGRAPEIEAAAGRTSIARACVRYRPEQPQAPLDLAVPGQGLVVDADGELLVYMRRFASKFPAAPSIRVVEPTGPVELQMRRGRAPQPWHARLTATGRITACGLG
jgi:hypothetical protein